MADEGERAVEDLEIRPEWMKAYVAQEEAVGVGGVLLVHLPNECAYVMVNEKTFPKAFADGLQEVMESDPLFAYFVVEHGRQLTALKMSKCELLRRVHELVE